ncbi:ubiquitin-protein ligase peroxin 12 [Batrachochytrium dendrobatidis]|nr:ubiquitin-protein ligase peroxin 12 [Batrachochytrium dendrobatidis]
MNFLSHLDSSQIFSTEDAYKPFLFELISQDKMRELLQPAFKYILTVAAQSYPRWLLLAYRHDKLIYALIMAIIDYHRLCRWGGSFTETFYGLCRSGVKDSSSTTTSLSPSQIRKSLAALILVPLVKSKLDEIHERLAQRRTSERFVGFVPESDSETQIPSTNLFNSSSNLEKLGKIAVKVFKAGYPYTNAAYSAIILGFQIAYMYGKTPYYSPWLYLCGLKLKRLSVSDYVSILYIFICIHHTYSIHVLFTCLARIRSQSKADKRTGFRCNIQLSWHAIRCSCTAICSG